MQWIVGDSFPDGPIRLVFTRCRKWLNVAWDVSLKHINREQNRVADFIAMMACYKAIHWTNFLEPPEHVVTLM